MPKSSLTEFQTRTTTPKGWPLLESRGLAPGTVNLRLVAIRRLAYEAADSGLLSPEQAAGIRRIKGAKKLGVRVGNWLLANEARALWEFTAHAWNIASRARNSVASGASAARPFTHDDHAPDLHPCKRKCSKTSSGSLGILIVPKCSQIAGAGQRADQQLVVNAGR